jgi:hypothetical protein
MFQFPFRINYNKTKAISIGNARHRKPKFNKISWIKENVKTLGVHHGYNVDNEKIWKDIIDRMKNCIQVWKSRKLSYKGKTIIVKNLLFFTFSLIHDILLNFGFLWRALPIEIAFVLL